jgi:hypothetical protein
MSCSTRQIYVWCGVIAAAILVTIAWSASDQSFARSTMSEGDIASTPVTPGRETTLTSPDGRVAITFPTDFFTDTLIVTYTERAIASLPTNLVQVGPSFIIEAARASDGQPVTMYEMDGCPAVRGEPIGKDQCNTVPDGGFEITFHYTDGEIVASGISEDAFALAYHYTPDGTNGKWLPLTTVIDETSNQAIASTWYLTHFAFLGVAPPAPTANDGQVEVIVDDLDDEFARYQEPGCEGYWWHYWSENGTYDRHSYYTKDSDESHGRQNWGEWTPNLPESATYEIFAFIPWNHATSTSTHYLIEQDGAQIGAATINQLAISADWVSLGSYSLLAGTRSKVVLDDMTDDFGYAKRDIGFDALKFVCLDCGAMPTPTPTPQPTPIAFQINNVAAVDANGTDLAWDKLVMSDDDVTVEAQGTGDNPPSHVWARVEALQSGRGTGIRLEFSHTSNGTHIYRATHAASELVNRPSVLTVAAVVYEEEDFDYQVVETFMEDLGVPETRRMGIVWGDGDQAQNRPPANIDYFRAAGYETAQVSMIYYPSVTPDEFFIQNQADVMLYLGHGDHNNNYLYLHGDKEGRPAEVGTAWDKGLQTVIIFGCSVLDINDMNGWWDNTVSPGKEWVNQILGPQTWLGFQDYAPVVGDPDQEGETGLYALASERTGGESWISAWRKATGNNTSITSHKFVGAVAIDRQVCEYYYWKEHCYPIVGCTRYTWESVSCANWNSSNQQLQALLNFSAEIHFYDAQGRHLGPDGQGGIDTEIPGSAYWTPVIAEQADISARRLSIQAADLSHGYRIELAGTGNGTFDLHLEIPDRSTGRLYQTTYISVPVTVGDEFVVSLERGTDFVLAANRDGDETFEGQVTPSSISSRGIDAPVNLVLNGTIGANGWYQSDVAAALQGSTRPDLPPLASLEYDLGSGWQTYTAPLTLAQEGTHTLHYRGTFVGGTQDVTQWVIIHLDKTPPALTLTSPTAITYTLCPYTDTMYTGAFTVTYQADDAVSGLQTVSATLAGDVITNGQTLETLFLPPGPHELVIIAKDQAGWQTVRRQPIFIEAQIEDLNSAVTRLWNLGLISGPGASDVITGLHTTLSAAQSARDSGDVTTAVNHLHAFVHDIEAQFPAPISIEAAWVLIRGAQYVTNRLAEEIAVSPTFGGQLFSPNFRITAQFPPDAVDTSSIAAYRTLTTTPPITLPRLSPVFDLSAYEYATGNPVTHFQQPVTLSVQYEDGEVGGLGERWLALHSWDEANSVWEMIPTTVDVARDQTVVQVDHFTIYTLLERKHTDVFLPLVMRH